MSKKRSTSTLPGKAGDVVFFPNFFSSVKRVLTYWSEEHPIVIALIIVLVGDLPLFFSLHNKIQFDLVYYGQFIYQLQMGHVPYRDFAMGFPPYIFVVLLLPFLFGTTAYFKSFMVTVLMADGLIKALLFMAGLRSGRSGWARFLPLIVYCLAILGLQFLYLQHLDVWPALVCLAVILLFSSERIALSGFFLALGMGLTLYPVLFVAPLFIFAMKQRKGTHFVGGLFIGLIPILLLSFWFPWWRFAKFESHGLQAESLYASLIWFGKDLGFCQASWLHAQKWYEVAGASANVISSWARLIFISAVVASLGLIGWAVAKSRICSASQIARLLLVPLLGFVAFNTVLSPQYMIGLLPLAALAISQGNPWAIVSILLASVLTPYFYPVDEYFHQGLNFPETAILLLRNVLLVIAWILLVMELILHLRSGTVTRPTAVESKVFGCKI